MKPDKIDNGFLDLLFAGPASPALGQVPGYLRRLGRRQFTISRQE